jgi:hypothetical protein
VIALTPGPEDAEQQEDGAGNLANSTHSPNTIPAAAAVTRSAAHALRHLAAGWPPCREIYRSGWAMVSITAVTARIRTSFSPGNTSTP